MQKLWLLDNGHGGLIDGVYQTEGKRSPKWDDGTQLFEGVFNRKVVRRIIEIAEIQGLDTVNIVPGEEDMPLRDRVKKANKIHFENQGKAHCIYVSVHANAGGGTGYEVYTTPGETESDNIARIFFNHAQAEFPTFKMRTDYSDGDEDKESLFYVLKSTAMPAILTENFFMDRYDPDYLLISSDEGVERVALAHVKAMLAYEGKKFDYDKYDDSDFSKEEVRTDDEPPVYASSNPDFQTENLVNEADSTNVVEPIIEPTGDGIIFHEDEQAEEPFIDEDEQAEEPFIDEDEQAEEKVSSNKAKKTTGKKTGK